MNMSPFLNQFLLSDKVVPQLEDWPTVKVGGNILYTHPKLEISVKQEANSQLILVGYWYDYRQPEKTNGEIINSLDILCSTDELLDQLQFMSGVYFVIWKTNDKIIIFPDFCALREVYIDKSSSSIVAGSTPNILRIIRPVQDLIDDDFYRSPVFKSRLIWVGHYTYYKNIIRLKPNHYIDLSTGDIVRFFPNEKLVIKDVKEVALEASKIFPNLMKAVRYREKKLMMGLTAGWDSRLLLAASREISTQLTYFVNIYAQASPYDQKIPAMLAAKFNLTFLRLQFSNKNTLPSLAEYNKYLPNVAEITLIKLSDFSNLFGSYKTISGSLSEISRNEFGRIKNVTGKKLAALAKFPDDAFCIGVYNDWLNSNRDRFTSLNYQVLDMFYWEEVLANRLGKSITESHAFDTYIFPIFNCRYVITTLLSAHTSFRDKQNNILYTEIIKLLWNDVLSQPINPGLKKKVIQTMQKIGVYDLYRSTFTSGVASFKKIFR